MTEQIHVGPLQIARTISVLNRYPVAKNIVRINTKLMAMHLL